MATNQTPTFASLLEHSLRRRLHDSIERLDRVQAACLSKQSNLVYARQERPTTEAERVKITLISYDADNSLEDLKDAKKELLLDVLRYGQLTCRHLCDAMQTKLPREVRDMIYGYISTRDTVHISVVDYTDDLSSILLHSSERCQWKMRSQQKQHYWRPSWIGYQTCDELIQNYGRTSHFRVSAVAERSHEALSFLAYDFWGIGIQPGKYIRAIEIGVAPLLRPGGQYEGFLDSLRYIPPGMRVRFRPAMYMLPGVSDPEERSPPRQYAKVLESWWPVYQFLGEKDCKVSVLLRLSKCRLELDSENLGFSKEKWLERAAAV